MRDFFLLLHIVLVCIWLGANVVQGFAAASNSKASKEVREWWATLQGAMARVLYNVAGVGTLITGLVLVLTSDGAYSMADPFVSIGFAAVIIGAGLGMGVFGPGTRKLVGAIQSGDDAEEEALNKKLGMFGVIDSLVVVFTIYAMVAKIGI